MAWQSYIGFWYLKDNMKIDITLNIMMRKIPSQYTELLLAENRIEVSM